MQGLYAVSLSDSSWTPPLDQEVARDVLAFLEDRAVLYNPYEVELPEECIGSVQLIRQHITRLLRRSGVSQELVESLRAIRAACRRFLDAVGRSPGGGEWGPGGAMTSLEFNQALGELRATVGIHVGVMAVRYDIEIEDDLARTLPALDARR
jgi:hypothetical protein